MGAAGKVAAIQPGKGLSQGVGIKQADRRAGGRLHPVIVPQGRQTVAAGQDQIAAKYQAGIGLWPLPIRHAGKEPQAVLRQADVLGGGELLADGGGGAAGGGIAKRLVALNHGDRFVAVAQLKQVPGDRRAHRRTTGDDNIKIRDIVHWAVHSIVSAALTHGRIDCKPSGLSVLSVFKQGAETSWHKLVPRPTFGPTGRYRRICRSTGYPLRS